MGGSSSKRVAPDDAPPKVASIDASACPPTVAEALTELLSLRAKMLSLPLSYTAPYTGEVHQEVLAALQRMKEVTEAPDVKAWCKQRLEKNESEFIAYAAENAAKESEEQVGGDETDFFSVPKCDTHLHLSAVMTSPQLWSYLRELRDEHGERIVDEETGLTVKAVLEESGFADGKRDLDDMRTIATKDMFRDFGKFNQGARRRGPGDHQRPQAPLRLPPPGPREQLRGAAISGAQVTLLGRAGIANTARLFSHT